MHTKLLVAGVIVAGTLLGVRIAAADDVHLHQHEHQHQSQHQHQHWDSGDSGCCVLPEPTQFAGYHPTCWRRWPTPWGCARREIARPVPESAPSQQPERPQDRGQPEELRQPEEPGQPEQMPTEPPSDRTDPTPEEPLRIEPASSSKTGWLMRQGARQYTGELQRSLHRPTAEPRRFVGAASVQRNYRSTFSMRSASSNRSAISRMLRR